MVSARKVLSKLTHEPLFVTNDELGQTFSLRQCYNWTMPRPAAICYVQAFLIPADDLEDILAEWMISRRHHPKTSIWLEAIYKKRTKEELMPLCTYVILECRRREQPGNVLKRIRHLENTAYLERS